MAGMCRTKTSGNGDRSHLADRLVKGQRMQRQMEAQVERRGVHESNTKPARKVSKGGAAADKDQKLWLVRLQLANATPNNDTSVA